MSDWQEQVSLQQNELGQLSGSESQLSSRQSILERKLQSFESRSNISAVSVAVDDINDLKQQVDLAASIMGAKQSVANFYHKCLGNNSSGNNQTDLKSHLQQELAEVTEELQVVLGKKREKEIKLKSLENEVQKAVQTVSDIESQIQQASAGRIESVKKLEQVKHQLQSTSDEIESVKASQQELESDSTTYNDRRTKISSIYGRSVIDNPSISINAGEEIANRLRDTKRQVLRLEAQLEDADISALPALRVELETEGQRLNHLQTERHDVETSMLRTRELVSDLSSQIETKMEVGLSQINTNLERFFRILFGGGACQLKSAKDGDKRGIAITLQLPYKRIKSVHALSGGERSLASLAILFAITLLSPPPFVVLDETDAALDEANSRRYAKLVRELAEHTQLILITHNRETMTFADELYGVTMGSDGISRLLSVTLKEAQPMGKN